MADASVEVKDEHDDAFSFPSLGDFLLTPFSTIPDINQHARDIRQLEMNPGDVIIAGFPRSGTHWTYELVYMLTRGRVEYSVRKEEKKACWDMNPITQDSIPPADTPRIFCSHLLFHHFPRQVAERQVKLVCLLRDPRDVWVSWFQLLRDFKGSVGFTGSWDQFFDHMLTSGVRYGSWFDYVLNWEAVIERETAAGLPIFVSRYEDLIKDPVGHVCKLDAFLGCSRGRQLCEQIADACQFPRLKHRKEEAMREEMEQVFHPRAAGYYRKGQVGDWRNWFTVAQRERFDQEFKERMMDSKLRDTF